jgi:hypothetical protein
MSRDGLRAVWSFKVRYNRDTDLAANPLRALAGVPTHRSIARDFTTPHVFANPHRDTHDTSVTGDGKHSAKREGGCRGHGVDCLVVDRHLHFPVFPDVNTDIVSDLIITKETLI